MSGAESWSAIRKSNKRGQIRLGAHQIRQSGVLPVESHVQSYEDFCLFSRWISSQSFAVNVRCGIISFVVTHVFAS